MLFQDFFQGTQFFLRKLTFRRVHFYRTQFFHEAYVNVGNPSQSAYNSCYASYSQMHRQSWNKRTDEPKLVMLTSFRD